MTCQQQKFREPNLFGHVYDGQKTDEGYAVCSACGSVENTDMAACACSGTMVGRRLRDCLVATERSRDFRKELERLINSFSQENGSDTPDFILADYLAGCLNVFDRAIRQRSDWYHKAPTH